MEAPAGSFLRATPSIEGIKGTLAAIEEQTSEFNWGNLVLAVDAHIGYAYQGDDRSVLNVHSLQCRIMS
jgi:hypothetical protein